MCVLARKAYVAQHTLWAQRILSTSHPNRQDRKTQHQLHQSSRIHILSRSSTDKSKFSAKSSHREVYATTRQKPLSMSCLKSALSAPSCRASLTVLAFLYRS